MAWGVVCQMDAGVKGTMEGDVKMALALARGWLEGGRIDNSQVRPLDPRIMPGYLHIIYMPLTQLVLLFHLVIIFSTVMVPIYKKET